MSAFRKRRYNLCHRLRTRGIPVDVEQHAIQITTQEEFDALPKVARKHVDILMEQYGYVVQFYIPLQGSTVVLPNGQNLPPAIKFRRKRTRSPDDRTESA